MDIKSINRLATKAKSEIQKLNGEITKVTKPLPAESYALFSHGIHAMERVDDVKNILQRLIKGREKLTKIHKTIELKKPKNYPAGVKYPKEISQLLAKSSNVTNLMKLDFESLYMFGDALLDQWAIITLYSIGYEKLKPHNYSFQKLVEGLEENQIPILDELWRELKSEIMWLHSYLRFYRNKFVVHKNRPLGRASRFSREGFDFKLVRTPTFAWLDEAEIELEINSLIHLAPKWLPDDYLRNSRPEEFLKILFNNLEDISNKEDREKIRYLIMQIGVTTPSFDIIGQKLLDFIAKSTPVVLKIALKNVNKINLGKGKGLNKQKERFYESLTDEQKKNLECGNKVYNVIWRYLNNR